MASDIVIELNKTLEEIFGARDDNLNPENVISEKDDKKN